MALLFWVQSPAVKEGTLAARTREEQIVTAFHRKLGRLLKRGRSERDCREFWMLVDEFHEWLQASQARKGEVVTMK